MSDPAAPTRLPVVVMGVSGSGKSTLGAALAQALGLRFVEGDSLHDAHSVDKMRSGQPLDDADRAGWLDAIAVRLRDRAHYPQGLVVSCSALKRAYRDRLRHATPDLRFLYLQIDAAAAHQRLRHRTDHFMPASLVPSQFAALERPAPDESDTVTLEAGAPPATVLAAALEALRARPPRAPAALPGALQ
jgi:gluconokinase